MKTTLCILAAAGLLALQASAQTLHILSIGVEPLKSFHSANDPYAHDAGHMARVLLAARPLYKAVHSKVVRGRDATPENVKAALRELADMAKDPKDVVFVHFSTHGGWSARDGFAFSLIGTEDHKVWQDFRDTDALRPLATIKGRVLLTLDTCGAAGIIPKGSTATPRISYLTACGREESSVGEGRGIQKPHGVFVTAFCEALGGSADLNHDGTVTWGEVLAYLPERATAIAPEQHAVARTQPGAEAIPLAKLAVASQPPATTATPTVATAAPKPAPLFDETVARNPFGLPDVNKPFLARFKEFWQNTNIRGAEKDDNAPAWADITLPQAADITGRWSARWKNYNGDWITGEAIIKVKEDRTFIIYRDPQARYLFELRTQKATQFPGHRLIGRYVNLADEDDNGPWVGMVVGNDRMDGKFTTGRWDFRRVIGPKPEPKP